MKCNILKFVCLTIILFISINTQAQKTDRPSDWKIFKEVNGVQFYYKYSECHDYNQGFHKEYVLIKLVNLTQTTLICEWDYDTWYHGECTSCPTDKQERSPENHRKVELIGGEEKEGSCDFNEFKNLKIFSKHLNYDNPKSELTAFELLNINVYPK